MTDIPEDVMKAARSAATTRLFSDRADKQADELTRHISRAIMAERERCKGLAIAEEERRQGGKPFRCSRGPETGQ